MFKLQLTIFHFLSNLKLTSGNPFQFENLLFGKRLKNPLENIVGKGENAGNQNLSPNLFYTSLNKIPSLSHIYFVICKCFQFGKVLTIYQSTC